MPVLRNKMLVTETLPLPIRGNSTKEFKFDKLINSAKSNTLKHERLTLEFTSNPAWYAVQALPYLMEYPHECSEQVFSRYYANSLASHIMNSSAKIKRVFDSWKNTDNSKALLSNLEKNQELKALMLEETPWVLAAKDETQRKKNLALLFDLNKMSNELYNALKKLKEMQSSNGGWPWFDGMPESRYITRHIVSGMGHLNDLNVINTNADYDLRQMLKNAVNYLDIRIKEDYDRLLELYDKEELKEKKISYNQIHYLYARSYYTNISIPNFAKEAYKYYYGQAGKYWLEESKYMQGMIALALHRFGDKEVPGKIINSLREFSIKSDEMGMYWKEKSGYYWYQAPIERHALFIEAFDKIADDKEAVEEMKIWLLKQKQTQNWKTTKSTVEAVYALLLSGTNLLESDKIVDIQLGSIKIDPEKDETINTEAGTGYFKKTWTGSEIKPEMGNVKLTKNDDGIAWGGLYWQYFEQLDKKIWCLYRLNIKMAHTFTSFRMLVLL